MNNIFDMMNEAFDRRLQEETEEERREVKKKLDVLDLEIRRVREAKTGKPGRTKLFGKFKRVRDGKYVARIHGLTAEEVSDYMDWVEEASERTGIPVDFEDNLRIGNTRPSTIAKGDDYKDYNLDVIIYAD